ncbi:SDR family oxidoreductase [Radiobacillus sp. PE A8.2]|uniref:SDR family oxidoreductase n=1 Tax=Radiobacillus sp. PE A8.2 TaxID=3380349 RepID=UPI0038900741
MVHGKVALITGAGSGMGRVVALRLAKSGAKVVLIDLHEEAIKTTKREIEQIAGSALAVPCDISRSTEMNAAFEQVAKKWDRLDVVFANAGIVGMLNSIESMEVEDWEKTININVTGTFLTVKHSIPLLKKHGGSIIITSSVSGNRVFSQAGFSTYSTSKAAQVAFMKMAALELATYKIRVNAICPGGIKTGIQKSIKKSEHLNDIRIPHKFPKGDQPLEHDKGTPEQVADLVEFLAFEKSSHITGTEIYIDGGESLLRG